MSLEVLQGDDSVDLVGKAGETFRCWFRFTESDGKTPVNLATVSEARLKVKTRPEDAVAILDLQIGQGLTINANAGEVEVFFSDEQTAGKVGVYVFDLLLSFANGDKYYLVGGGHQLLKPVTT